MTTERPDSNPMPEPMLDWLGGSLPYLPSIFDDPYHSEDFTSDSWWVQNQSSDQDQIKNTSSSFNINSPITTDTSIAHLEPIFEDKPLLYEPSKKRKPCTELDPKTSKTTRKNQNKKASDADGEDASTEQVPPARKSAGNKKQGAKSSSSSSDGSSKDCRWAEQLLNPCAAAISTSNQARIQHLLCVIKELASLTGDSNHRLAAHGLRALTQHISTSGSSNFTDGSNTFATTNSKFFTTSLINFNDLNPWFRIPNSIANSSILQILAEQDKPKNLHILDIGVSHGIQWPTLLEELSRRPGGPPPSVRITLITETMEDQKSKNTPFLVSPQGYNCSTQLLSFAKAININLQINRLENFPLLNLDSQVIKSTPDETLIVCTQFRLHNLSHNSPDERTQFLKTLRSMNPSGIFLSENSVECSCNNCVDFATGFSRKVEYLWQFLDSTSVAYKGRESDERRMMEGEAAKALTNAEEMNEKEEKWRERMSSVGFKKETFVDDAIEGARALLRKYDSNWEIRAEEKDGWINLLWKGQPVSFCSLWKCDPECKRKEEGNSRC